MSGNMLTTMPRIEMAKGKVEGDRAVFITVMAEWLCHASLPSRNTPGSEITVKYNGTTSGVYMNSHTGLLQMSVSVSGGKVTIPSAADGHCVRRGERPTQPWPRTTRPSRAPRSLSSPPPCRTKERLSRIIYTVAAILILHFRLSYKCAAGFRS